MNLTRLFNLQGMLLLLMLLGALLRKRNLINREGEAVIGDLVICVFLPCSIFQSFQSDLTPEVLLGAVQVFLITLGIILLCVLLNCFLYRKEPEAREKVLQYGTLFSNSGILGNAVAESVFGAEGLFYASIYMIPLRAVMWSYGLTFFTKAPDARTLVRKVCTHPCIIAVFLGLLSLLSGIRLPGFLSETVASLGRANTPVSMIFVGTILASVRKEHFQEKTVWYYLFIRLLLIPAIVLSVMKLPRADELITGVCVLLSAMPMAATSAVMAAKYECDAVLATECIVLSTLLSMVTLPLWCMLMMAL